jgi:hypothetical protein
MRGIEKRVRILEGRACAGETKPLSICVQFYSGEKTRCPGYDDTGRCVRYKGAEETEGNNHQVFIQKCEGCGGVQETEGVAESSSSLRK